MRKVFAGLFSSVDGVVQAPNEWQPAFDEEMGAALDRMLDGQVRRVEHAGIRRLVEQHPDQGAAH